MWLHFKPLLYGLEIYLECIVIQPEPHFWSGRQSTWFGRSKLTILYLFITYKPYAYCHFSLTLKIHHRLCVPIIYWPRPKDITQLEEIWKMTSIILKMEENLNSFFHMADDLNILLNKTTSIFVFKYKKGKKIMQPKTIKS